MDETLFNKVKDYFSGQMNREEQLQFEAALTNNKELAAMVDLYQTIEQGIFENYEQLTEEENLLRNTIQKVHEQFVAAELQQDTDQEESIEEEQPGVIRPEKEVHASDATGSGVTQIQKGKVRSIAVWKRLAVAAILIGIVSMISIWFLNWENNSSTVVAEKSKEEKSKNNIGQDTAQQQNNLRDNVAIENKSNATIKKQDSMQLAKRSVLSKAERETLYARNFKPDNIPSNFSELLQEALGYYKDREYNDAIAAVDINDIKTSIEALRPRGQQNKLQEKEEQQTVFYAYYYKALSYLATNNAEKAIPELQNALLNSPDKFWQAKAQWYLGLAFLKTGNIKEAKWWLTQVAHNPKAGAYQQKAMQLISELDKSK